MGKHCSVPKCKSGYENNPQKVSIFRVLVGKVNQWQKLIPHDDKELTSKDFISEKHFQSNFIIREVKTDTFSVNIITHYMRLQSKQQKEYC